MSDVVEVELRPVGTPPSKGGTLTRVVRIVGWLSIGLGLFLVGFVLHQLFVTTFFAQQNNETLKVEVVEYFDEAAVTEVEYVPVESLIPDTPTDSTAPPDSVGPPEIEKTLLVEPTPVVGEPFAIIRIPSLERLADGWTIVEGVSVSDLRNGVGHMPNTPLPGQPGNSVLPGHRTTYGAPFHELDELVPGDIIEVETALGVNTYEVRESIIVKPTEIWVTDPRPGSWITLSTCNPKFSSRERLIIFAELVAGPNYDVIYNA
ncbi:MAG: sortase [Acidimicrobiia bacterium]